MTVEDLEALFGGIAYQVDQNLYGFVDETVEVVFWGGQVESIRFKWMQEPESKWASWFPPA
ncbi:hypothetical protein [Deinococcus misasensis]|uniref:hypothetical protein n=1 Tax=Deinococcus misasensis TaxID=392413 RepID=UPI00054ED057|nr:hypothetical protein [Deinococcus misasensis]